MGSRVQNQTSEAEIDRTPGIQSLQKWLEGPRNGWEVTTTLTNLPTRETSIPAFLVNMGTWKLPVNWVQRQYDAVNTQNKDNYHCPWKPRKLVSSTFFRTLAAREPGNHSFCLSHSVTIEKKKRKMYAELPLAIKGILRASVKEAWHSHARFDFHLRLHLNGEMAFLPLLSSPIQ